MTREEQIALQKAARSPEVQMVLDHLLNKEGLLVSSRENESVFKGFMLAYYTILNLQTMKITKE